MATNKIHNIHGYKVQYLAAFRTGKSRYEGDSTYQIEVMVDSEREVFQEGGASSVRAAKDNFEWHLKLRRDNEVTA